MHNVRARLAVFFASSALTILSILFVCSPLISSARSAFAAPDHTAQAGAMLAVSPMNLINCTQCTVTVTNQSANKSLTWSAASHSIPGVTIKPAHGTLQPKKQAAVNITIPASTTCPANGTITFNGPANSVKVAWSCTATPTPTTPTPTATTALTLSPTPSASSTQTGTSPTPTTTPIPNGGGQDNNGNPPTSVAGGGSPDSSVPSIILSVAALLLALLAFTLYLIAPGRTPLRRRLLALFLPVSFLRQPGQNRR